jgi:hypothetical protein
MNEAASKSLIRQHMELREAVTVELRVHEEPPKSQFGARHKQIGVHAQLILRYVLSGEESSRFQSALPLAFLASSRQMAFMCPASAGRLLVAMSGASELWV